MLKNLLIVKKELVRPCPFVTNYFLSVAFTLMASASRRALVIKVRVIKIRVKNVSSAASDKTQHIVVGGSQATDTKTVR